MSEASGLRVEPLTGDALQRRLQDLAQLRIRIFREFPYLYDGSLDYEARYLATYAASAGSVIVAAFDGDALVGAATALPLAHEPENVKRPLAEAGFDTGRIFYFGESVLLPEYRGRGLGHAFFDVREAHARSFGTFDAACFCAVIRPEDHPLRPPGYRPLDKFWEKRGYRRLPGLTCTFSWLDLGEPVETPKPMAYWMRDL